MARIILATDGQRLIKVACPKIASGDKNADYLRVDFCPSWDGFGKTAVFYRTESEVYYAVMDNNNECVIPWEVLQTEGILYLGIFGSKDNIRKTSEVITYKIDKGAVVDNLIPSDPTPDIYDQLLVKYGEVSEKANAAAESANNAKKASDAATTAVNDHVSNKSNPHGVDKSQVGLGNVPNVSTNDQTPTYTVASALANLVSGEKLSVAFGKIAKAVADFISHIGNKSNPHGVTAEQIGAAPLINIGNYNDDLDYVPENTACWVSASTINNPTNYYGLCETWDSGIGGMVQRISTSIGCVQRIRTGNGWGEWEWVNPPMMPNTEYRTTKRHNGKAVYTKLIEYAPSNFTTQTFALPHGIANFDCGLSINVSWFMNGINWRHLPSVYFSDSAWNGHSYWNSIDGIAFELGESLRAHMADSSRNILVTVEYTKSE